MDAIDRELVRRLMANGRATWAELGAALKLSPPAVADRVRRLEERGLLIGFAALVDPEAAGFGLTAFVAVSLREPADRAPFLAWVEGACRVQACHHVAGDDDYLLLVRCRGTRDLERLVSDEIKSLPGIVRTRTTIVLSTVKETVQVPVEDGG